MKQAVQKWAEYYSGVENTLRNMRQVKAVATAFNTNVDAVLKISGRRLAELARETGLDWQALTEVKENKLLTPQDVIRGRLNVSAKDCRRMADRGYRRF